MHPFLPVAVGLLVSAVAGVMPATAQNGQTTLFDPWTDYALPGSGSSAWLRAQADTPVGASFVPGGRVPQDGRPPSVAKATAFSALLPGSGQHLLSQNRKWIYLAVEAAGWVLYADRISAGHDMRAQYRDFAWEEARISMGPRMDGDFDYYETLSKWGGSGAYDGDPGVPGVQPEMNPAVFNGSIWALAVRIFQPGPGAPPGDPRYESALAYYRDRAYGSEFLWDWTGTGGAQNEYGDLIKKSDDRFRQATNVLGVVIANHVVSAVDAFLGARSVGVATEAYFAPRPGPAGTGWTASFRVRRR